MTILLPDDIAGNGILELGRGTYVLDAPIVAQDGLTVRGQGTAWTTLKLADQANCLMFDVQGNEIEMHGLTLDGNCGNQDTPTYGIYAAYNKGSRSRFTDCTFRNFGKSALYMRGFDVIVRGCRFENIAGGGSEGAIRIRDGGGWFIEGNTFYLDDTNQAASAIHLEYAHECAVEGNIIEGGFFGTQIRGGWGHRITSNVIVRSYGAGIAANRGALHLCIANNYIADVVLERGIDLYQQDEQPEACIVVHNHIRNTRMGGIIVGGKRHTVEGNIVVNSGNDETAYPGINLVQAEACLVQHNRCTDTQGPKTQSYGVREASSCSDNVIWHNHLAGNLMGALLIEGQDTRVEDNIE